MRGARRLAAEHRRRLPVALRAYACARPQAGRDRDRGLPFQDPAYVLQAQAGLPQRADRLQPCHGGGVVQPVAAALRPAGGNAPMSDQ
ncbi:hypothetical protein [Actinacidiphila glaucinigra]|uniref:hypothetical protein n=1 Tax=Actinacidiphila glaucinigra TaxID=235986 RepID=UPI0036EDEFF3